MSNLSLSFESPGGVGAAVGAAATVDVAAGVAPVGAGFPEVVVEEELFISTLYDELQKKSQGKYNRELQQNQYRILLMDMEMNGYQKGAVACYALTFICMSVTLGVSGAMGARTHQINTNNENAKQAQSEVYTIIAFSACFILAALMTGGRGDMQQHQWWVPMAFVLIPFALSIDIFQNRIPGYMSDVDATCKSQIKKQRSRGKVSLKDSSDRDITCEVGKCAACDNYQEENANGGTMNLCNYGGDGSPNCYAKESYMYSDDSVAVLIAFLTIALVCILIAAGLSMNVPETVYNAAMDKTE